MNSSNTSTEIRVCLDTNILVSALLFGGKPDEILDLAARKQIKIISSPVILAELQQVLIKKFKWADNDVKQSLKSLMEILTLVFPQHKINTFKYGPDNRILECAVEGKADFIISGDKKHLLPLSEYNGIKIITPSQLLKIVRDS